MYLKGSLNLDLHASKHVMNVQHNDHILCQERWKKFRLCKMKLKWAWNILTDVHFWGAIFFRRLWKIFNGLQKRVQGTWKVLLTSLITSFKKQLHVTKISDENQKSGGGESPRFFLSPTAIQRKKVDLWVRHILIYLQSYSQYHSILSLQTIHVLICPIAHLDHFLKASKIEEWAPKKCRHQTFVFSCNNSGSFHTHIFSSFSSFVISFLPFATK